MTQTPTPGAVPYLRVDLLLHGWSDVPFVFAPDGGANGLGVAEGDDTFGDGGVGQESGSILSVVGVLGERVASEGYEYCEQNRGFRTETHGCSLLF